MLKLAVFMNASDALRLMGGGKYSAGDSKKHENSVKQAYRECGVTWTKEFVCIAATETKQERQAMIAGAYGTDRVPLLDKVIREIVIATVGDIQNACSARMPRPLTKIDGTQDERRQQLTDLATASDPNGYAECRMHRALEKADIDWDKYGVERETLEIRIGMEQS